MNYRLIRSAKTGKKTPLSIFLIGFLILIVCFYFFYPTAIQGAFQKAAEPVWKFSSFVQGLFQNLFAHFESEQALIEERDRLSSELQKKDAELADRDLVTEENKLLKAGLSRAGREKPILAAVLSSPPFSPYDTLVLDAGSFEGVHVGDGVYSGTSAVGVISKSFTHTSIAELFSTSGRKTPVSILHDGMAVPTEAVGQGGGTFKIILPKESPVRQGDIVLMPGIDPALFGRIDTIVGNVTDSFQTIYFRNSVPADRQIFLEIYPAHADQNI